MYKVKQRPCHMLLLPISQDQQHTACDRHSKSSLVHSTTTTHWQHGYIKSRHMYCTCRWLMYSLQSGKSCGGRRISDNRSIDNWNGNYRYQHSRHCQKWPNKLPWVPVSREAFGTRHLNLRLHCVWLRILAFTMLVSHLGYIKRGSSEWYCWSVGGSTVVLKQYSSFKNN